MNSGSPLILKGSIVHTIEEVPYIVQLKSKDDIICGGTILTTMLILTAAHCLNETDLDILSITAGELERYSISKDSQTRQIVKKITPNPKYKKSTHENDIAILLLNSPLQFNRKVNKVTLTDGPIVQRSYARVYGWGLTETNGPAERLLRTSVRILPDFKCKESYPFQSEFFPSKMICARGDFNMASCRGDSGSPMFCPTKLCGITSFGEDTPCSESTKPVVYTNIVAYLDWIKSIIKENENSEQKSSSVLCNSDQFTCKNNKCISMEYKCDEDNDCGDSSDELDCNNGSISKWFAPNEFLKASQGFNPTFFTQLRNRITDDFFQTAHSFNPVHSIEHAPNLMLPSSPKPEASSRMQNQHEQFSCPEKQIPKNKVCDKVIDCQNGADEASSCFGCSSDEISCNDKCYKKDNFCYFNRNTNNQQFGDFFGACHKFKTESGHNFSKTTIYRCHNTYFCENGFICIDCSITTNCFGENNNDCKNNYEVCNIKRRLRD